MGETRPRKLFVNLAVRDLPRAQEFFGRLGFACNIKFTDDNAACMVVSDHACWMDPAAVGTEQEAHA